MERVIKVWNADEYISLADATLDGAVVVCVIPSELDEETFVRAFREGMFAAQLKLGTGTELKAEVCEL